MQTTLARQSLEACVRMGRLMSAPAAEWRTIAADPPAIRTLMLGHTAPLSAVTALAWATGAILAPLRQGVSLPFAVIALTTFLLCLVSILLQAGAIALLLPMYDRRRDWHRALVVAAYAATPILLCGILFFVPTLVIVIAIALPYAGYLLFVGAHEVLGVGRGDAAEFAVASMIVMTAASFALGALLGALDLI